MEFALLGWPPDSPTLHLDYRRFAYAGKFVVGSTGKAVVQAGEKRDSEYDDHVLAAASFSPDRTDDDCLCIRYVTVRDDRQGEGLGARLLAFVALPVLAGFQTVVDTWSVPSLFGLLFLAIALGDADPWPLCSRRVAAWRRARDDDRRRLGPVERRGDAAPARYSDGSHTCSDATPL